MKLKSCPKCGCNDLGEIWTKGRMLRQYCRDENEMGCIWEGEPYTPELQSITNMMEISINDFPGWHYIVYDKFGHVAISSGTYHNHEEALEKLKNDITPKEGYNDPAAPYTAVLFNVPQYVTIKGEIFKLENGVITEIKN
jgi:hypothetical protein